MPTTSLSYFGVEAEHIFERKHKHYPLINVNIPKNGSTSINSWMEKIHFNSAISKHSKTYRFVVLREPMDRLISAFNMFWEREAIDYIIRALIHHSRGHTYDSKVLLHFYPQWIFVEHYESHFAKIDRFINLNNLQDGLNEISATISSSMVNQKPQNITGKVFINDIKELIFKNRHFFDNLLQKDYELYKQKT